jgi:hypothetical protein
MNIVGVAGSLLAVVGAIISLLERWLAIQSNRFPSYQL